MSTPADAHVTLLSWALGLVTAGALAALGWIWTRIGGVELRLDQRIAKVEDGATRTAKADDLRALWEAVNAEREKASKHREAIIAQLGHVATRDDLEKMEARILQHLPPR